MIANKSVMCTWPSEFGAWGMITFRLTTEVHDDRHVELALPAEIPTGRVDLVVTVIPRICKRPRRRRLPLSHWSDRHAERWSDKLGSAS